jgi:nitroreductase
MPKSDNVRDLKLEETGVQQQVKRQTGGANEITRFVRSLRAVRRFAEQDLPEDVLLDILDVARWTGSAKNTQPWHLIVVRARKILAELATYGPFAGHLAGARAAIVLVMDNANQRFDEGRLAENVMLAAWAHGVGSCIGSLYPDDNARRARALLGVPDGRWLHTAISLGYPADEQALRLSADRAGLTEVPIGRAELADLVSWEQFGQH